MGTIEGTIGADNLIGTDGDDLMLPFGTGLLTDPDLVSGGLGADTYRLSFPIGQKSVHSYIIDDNGTDGAHDRIEGVGALYYSASLGYQGWATAIRVGDDLIIDTPGKPHRFRSPSKPSFHIEIKDQYSGEAIEEMVVGGVSYNLATSNLGTLGADIIAGTDSKDVMFGYSGDDWMFGNGGNDRMKLGGGDDTAFGGEGRDRINGGSGDDTIFSGNGADRVVGGSGHDRLDTGAGNDVIRAGSGNDWIVAGDGDDRIWAGRGADTINGGAGDDWMSGGKEGDKYRFGATSSGSDWGHDTILDRGNKSSYKNIDVIELNGFYGPSSGNIGDAVARMSFERSGDDMILTADGGASSITVAQMFDANSNRFFVEQLSLNGAYWGPIVFMFLDGAVNNIGDDRDYPYGWKSKSNEIIFGTDDGESIYGNTGHNFIWTGDGADTLIYKENDPVPFSGYSATISHDIVQDFDITQDRLDFSEMKIGMSDLFIGEDADGDAIIRWYSPITYEITSILIELRGVSMDEVTEDLFIF